MIEIIQQINAKEKGFNIINSCENCYHYSCADKYINLYYNKFGDVLGKIELLGELKKIKLKNLGL